MLLLICLSMGLAVSFLFIGTKESMSDARQELYSAWCKSANRSDITYVEWYALYRNGLLPVTYIGQPINKSEEE